jgi:hypothetical protein
MKRFVLTGVAGFVCLLPLVGCVVAPARPVAVVPEPVVVGPPPLVVGPPVIVGRRPYYHRWYRGRPVYVRRGHYWRHRIH